MSRSVIPKKEVIRKLRDDLGWTQSRLAERIGCSLRTVQGVESGRSCQKQTLKDFAQALKVEYWLLEGESEQSISLQPPPTKPLVIVINVPISRKDVDECEIWREFISLMLTKVKPKFDVGGVGFFEGSLQIMFEIDAEDAEDYLKAWFDGRINYLSPSFGPALPLRDISVPITQDAQGKYRIFGEKVFRLKDHPDLVRGIHNQLFPRLDSSAPHSLAPQVTLFRRMLDWIKRIFYR